MERIGVADVRVWARFTGVGNRKTLLEIAGHEAGVNVKSPAKDTAAVILNKLPRIGADRRIAEQHMDFGRRENLCRWIYMRANIEIDGSLGVAGENPGERFPDDQLIPGRNLAREIVDVVFQASARARGRGNGPQDVGKELNGSRMVALVSFQLHPDGTAEIAGIEQRFIGFGLDLVANGLILLEINQEVASGRLKRHRRSGGD